ncbi:hypothetical protein AB0K05_41045 [Nonomuraea sp. NPDC049486]
MRKTVSGGLRLTPTEWHILEILLRNPGTSSPNPAWATATPREGGAKAA